MLLRDGGPGRAFAFAGIALFVALAGMLAFASRPVSGAVRTWSGLGLTNNWNEAANWLGGLIPGAADVATFDATGSKNATINVAVNVSGLSVTAAYGGSITQAAGVAMTVGAAGFTQTGAAFVGGTSNITLNGPLSLSAGSFTATSGTLTVTGATTVTGGTFNANGGSATFSGGAATIDTAGLVSLNNAAFSATKTIAAGTTLSVGGTLSLTGGSINGAGTVAAQGAINQALGYGGGSATLLVNGSGAQTLTGASTTASGNLPPLVINKPSGTLTLAGTLRTATGWTYTAGTLDPGSSTLVFAGGTITGSHSLNAVDVRATTSIAAGTTLTVTGSLSLTSGALNGTGSLAAQGSISQASTTTGGTATLLINGSGAQTLTGAATTAAGALPPVVINKPSGTLTLAGTLRTANSWTYTAGTVDPGSSTLVFAGGTITGSHSLNAVAFRATTTIAAGTTLTVLGTTTLTAGNLNTGTLAAAGDINQALGYGGGSATLLINGSGAQTLTGASTTASGNLPPLVINKPSGTLTLAGTLRTATGWTYTAGTLDPGSSTLVFAGGTITGSHSLNAVDVRATTSIAAGTTLTVTGSLSLTSGALNGTGSLAAQGSISQASTTTGGTATLLINGSGAQTLTGAATTAAGALPPVVINKPSGTLTLAGTLRTANSWTYTAGTVDPGSSTLVFAGGTITGSHSLNAVDVRATTSIAAGTTLTVTGSLSLTSGALNGTGSLAAQGSISQASTTTGGSATLLVNGSGAQTLTGASTTASGNLPPLVINKPSGTLTLAGTLRTATGWTYTAGTLDPGSSTLVFAGGTVRSVGMAFYDVVGNGGTTTLGTAMTVLHDLSVNAGTFTTSASNFALVISGSLTVVGTFRENGSSVSVAGNIVNNGTIVQGTSTLTLNGSLGQTISGSSSLPAFNLLVDDPAGVTLATDVVTTGTLTLTSGSFNLANRRLTINNPIAGTRTNLVTGANSSITVAGAAAGITLPTSVTLLNNLTVSNTSGLAVSVDLTIGGTLTLSGGPVTDGMATIHIALTGTVVRTTGRVVGKLGKTLSTGAAVPATFEIGDAARYAPVTLLFASITSAGEIVASTTPGDHPDIANSGLAPTRSVNRWWTLTNAGLLFTTYDATFTFVPADVDPGSTTAVFVVGKRDGTTWTLTPPGTRTATSTQALGLTSFSEFAVGEPTVDLAVSVSDGLASVVAGDGLTHAYTIAVSNDGASDATLVSLTDSWPTGFVQGAINPSQGSCSPIGAGPDFSCALGTIAAGANATVSVAYTVPASTAAGVQTETVSVSSPLVDAAPTNDTASDTTTVIESSALTVVKDDGLATVVAGDGLSHGYTITISNAGPSDADSVALEDSVPSALTVGTPSADLGGDCTGSLGNTIACALPASLAVGATWTVTVPYTVGPGATPGTVTNTARATSAENPGGITGSDATAIVGSVDLAVSVSDGLASVVAGDGLTHAYTIAVSNDGASDATLVSLTDSWPTGFVQGAINPSQGSCSPIGAGPDFSCALGTIAAGANATVSVAYTVPASTAAGVQTETVSVSSPLVDADPTNDTASDTTTVIESSAPGGGGQAPETGTLLPAGPTTAALSLIAALLVVCGSFLIAVRRLDRSPDRRHRKSPHARPRR